MTVSSAWEVYVAGFRSTAEAAVATRKDATEVPGMVGRVGTEHSPDGRLLITDDSAWETLERTGDPHATLVVVRADAGRCLEHMRLTARYRSDDASAMVCRDLARLPAVPLVPELSLRAAALPAGLDEVPLQEAAAAFMRADPVDDDETPEGFARYLASIPGGILLAAVDHAGAVRATAGAAAFGAAARVFFVSTDSQWRGRGIGTAMTAAALHSARSRGATMACLDATALGRPIYARLGFEFASEVVVFTPLGIS